MLANVLKGLSGFGSVFTVLLGKTGTLGTLAEDAVTVMPEVIKDVQALEPIVMNFFATVKSGKAPTQTEWDALHTSIASLTAEIMAATPTAGTP